MIAPDLPGFGDSSHPLAGYDKKTVAATLRAVIMSLGHRQIRLVGHDVGGQVAYAYAAQWPHEVLHLTLIECAIPGVMDNCVANPLAGGSWHYGFNMLADLPEALVRDRERAFLRFVLFRDNVGVFQTDAIGEQDLDVYEAGLGRPGGLRASFGYYRSLPQDAADNINWVTHKLPMPTLTVAGAEAYGPNWLASMQTVAVTVERLLIADSGHYIPEEQPTVLAEKLITSWVRDAGKSS